MNRARSAVLLLAALTLLPFDGCGGPTAPGVVVLITLDTTRADRLGCYGYEAAETPNLDALAAEGVLFRDALAPVPVTLPTHATIFTGTYPPVHGIRYNGMFQLPQASVTLAELFDEAGWMTAGVPAAFPLITRTGIGQGFEIYHDMFQEIPESEWNDELERSATDTTDLGLQLLREAGDRPFLMWLHYWSPHYPYEPPFPYSGRYRDRPYDGEIAYMDEQLGRLFDGLRESGRWADTLIVVVGDHGEGLYDHNEKMHANLVYQTTMQVPLIVKPSGTSRSRVVAEPVGLTDIAPTILELAGIGREAAAAMEGISLVPALRGETPPRRYLYFESLAGSLVFGWSPLTGVRRGPWKYTRSSDPELYDLEADPGELLNLHEVEAGLAADFEAVLAGWEEEWAATATAAAGASTPVDPREMEMLASLGYIGGFVTEERQGGPHPRDVVHLERDVVVVRELAREDNWGGALARCEMILQSDPTNRFVLWFAASAAAELGRFERAHELAREGLALYPEFTPVRVLEGELTVRDGDLERAAEIYREGVELHPEDSGLNYRLAVALYGLDRLEEALAIAESFIARNLEAESFLVVRAASRAKQGDPDGALESLEQAIDRGYRQREALETEPMLEPLRRVPGFAELVSRIPPQESEAPKDEPS